ncbi:hypothetical protein C8Q80DRAFT_1264427 [Daedaleopsis nitida]|nr:hypothetical protein C8Q80DRAFT_1264427 [Daedaleopsis nitida]
MAQQKPMPTPASESKQPEFKFRTKPVQDRSIWESWAVLPAKTRLRVSLAITAFAGLGILLSDKLEKTLPPPKDASVPETSSATTESS